MTLRQRANAFFANPYVRIVTGLALVAAIQVYVSRFMATQAGNYEGLEYFEHVADDLKETAKAGFESATTGVSKNLIGIGIFTTVLGALFAGLSRVASGRVFADENKSNALDPAAPAPEVGADNPAAAPEAVADNPAAEPEVVADTPAVEPVAAPETEAAAPTTTEPTADPAASTQTTVPAPQGAANDDSAASAKAKVVQFADAQAAQQPEASAKPSKSARGSFVPRGPANVPSFTTMLNIAYNSTRRATGLGGRRGSADASSTARSDAAHTDPAATAAAGSANPQPAARTAPAP